MMLKSLGQWALKDKGQEGFIVTLFETVSEKKALYYKIEREENENENLDLHKYWFYNGSKKDRWHFIKFLNTKKIKFHLWVYKRKEGNK